MCHLVRSSKDPEPGDSSSHDKLVTQLSDCMANSTPHSSPLPGCPIMTSAVVRMNTCI